MESVHLHALGGVKKVDTSYPPSSLHQIADFVGGDTLTKDTDSIATRRWFT